ncbi:MAG: hypothetical protein H7Y05_07355 [Steroidobacteraceae bacterium]|nr:hypothetical protein [Deltaproteobacteria bacterium]
MKRVISTIAAIGFVSSMLVNTAYAGNRHVDVLNPLWVPAAILSTLAAVTVSLPQPVVYERRAYSEPRQTVNYEEPRHYRQDNYYDRAYRAPRHYRQARYYDRDRDCETPRHRDYR